MLSRIGIDNTNSPEVNRPALNASTVHPTLRNYICHVRNHMNNTNCHEMYCNVNTLIQNLTIIEFALVVFEYFPFPFGR